MAGEADSIRDALHIRYGGSTQRESIVEFVLSIYLRLSEDRLLGRECAGRLRSRDDDSYYQTLSELLIANELLTAGFALRRREQEGGPDFLIEHENERIFIEVICPSPTGIPREFLNLQKGTAYTVPHEQILLRWTAALKEKYEKLVGNNERGLTGYLDRGWVTDRDIYVIAINGRRLAYHRDLSFTGITQRPYAVEAVFPVGPLQVTLDTTTAEIRHTEHQYRPVIAKPNGGRVPTSAFLNEEFAAISAIWAAAIDETIAVQGHRNDKLLSVVHNPLATRGVRQKLLPSQSEFFVQPISEDTYKLREIDGTLY